MFGLSRMDSTVVCSKYKDAQSVGMAIFFSCFNFPYQHLLHSVFYVEMTRFLGFFSQLAKVDFCLLWLCECRLQIQCSAYVSVYVEFTLLVLQTNIESTTATLHKECYCTL